MTVNPDHQRTDGEPDFENLGIAYFLGRLSEDERDRIRERLVSDDEVVSIFEGVENDLADQYVRGELSPADQLAFERHFPSIEKLRYARLMQSRRIRSWKRFVLPVALAATFVIAAGLAFLTPRHPPPAAVAENKSVLFAFSLPPGTTRSALAPRTIDIPKDANVIEIRLGLEPPVAHLSYTVVLKNQRGQDVFSARNLPARRPPAAPSVDAHIASQILVPGTFEVTLYGLNTEGVDELIDYYAFRIR
jgi:hypothetical protein